MLASFTRRLKQVASVKSVETISWYGFLARIIALAYSIFHDSFVNHIKYTDIDYHVFTNGSRAITEYRSPYEDAEYRYSPIVALIFVPNVLISVNFGKLLLIIADIMCGMLIYMLNIYQGTDKLYSKLFLLLWLFNPVTIAISTRGSFEPIITLLVLASIHMLLERHFTLAGFLYGLSIHVKLYPVIYALPFYCYITHKKPYTPNTRRLVHLMSTLKPSRSHFKFFLTGACSLGLASYLSYLVYGYEYLEQSLIYHMKRIDSQHNFSFYFYLFRLFPDLQNEISMAAFVIQSTGVLIVSLYCFDFAENRRVKLRNLTFGLFGTTFIFVTLNKVCTSQYFSWYLIFLPLISDSLKVEISQAYALAAAWMLSLATWLLSAYLYEYQKYDVLDFVGNSSFLFLVSNLWIICSLCNSFDAKPKSLRAKQELRKLL